MGFVDQLASNDATWGATWRNGAREVEEHFDGKVQTETKFAVPDTQVESVMRSMIQDGDKVIVGTTFSHQKAALKLAAANPDVTFLQVESVKTLPNLATVDFFAADGFYIAGMAAAGASDGGSLGIVGAFPIPSNLSFVNAWQLGAQQIKPSATTKVVWTNAWADDAKGQSAARALVNNGVDVLGTLMSGPGVIPPVAKAEDVPWVSQNTDIGRFAPDQYLTGVLVDWGPYLIQQIQAVLDDDWKTGSYMLTMANGGIKMAPWGAAYDRVSADDQAKIDTALEGMKAGTVHPITGPVTDQAGKERVPAGKVADASEVLSTNYLVQGVQGTIPAAG